MNLTAAQPKPNQSQVKLNVMTFNVRYGTADDGENSWPNRRDIFFECLNQNKPAILAVQEGLKQQLEAIKNQFPEWDYIGIGRYHGVEIERRPHETFEGEHCAIFYDTSRFNRIDDGTFWLSDTPDVPASQTWGNDLPRIATWGIFEEKEMGKRFAIFNTHFHWGDEIVRKSAKLILKKMKQFAPEMPIILAGDFNLKPDSEVHALLTDKSANAKKRPILKDCWNACGMSEENAGSSHSFTGMPQKRIDWILVSPEIKPRAIQRIDFNRDGKYPSDHFPVMAELEF